MELELNKLREINNRFCSKWYINYSDLDKDQQEIYDDDNSFIVLGCAGSGKSVLAIHKLLKILQKNKNYKMVIYTNALRSFIIDGLDSLIKIIKDIDMENIKKPLSSLQKDIVICDSLTSSDMLLKQDFLIIDEMQDIYKYKFEILANNSSVIMCFGDFDQILYNDRLTKSDIEESTYEKIKRYDLTNCYRLPMSVAIFAENIILNKLNDKCIKKANEHKPYLIQCEISNGKTYYVNEIKCLVDLIDKQKLKDVGVLVNDNESVKSVYNILKKLIDKKYKSNPLKKPKIGYKYNEELELEFGTRNSINIICFHSCKGTEFENVFILKCDTESIRNGGQLNYKQALYVACTRTAQRLFITYSKPICSFIPYQKTDLYNKYIYDGNKLILQKERS